ncbi:MAG: PilZ domain-containing protein [Deltaproteobacteria bacterium]|nr:PilZ domain-containing protein [Deltaproteobacteria bacterium]
MGSQPADRRTATRYVATFRIRLGYSDLDAFLDGYAVNISKGGIYVPTKQPREKGTEVRFELLLKDGSAAVVGVGKVAWSKPFDPAKPGERYGMGVQFLGLEGASESIIERAMAWREKHLPDAEAQKEVVERESVPAAPEAPEKAAAAAEPAAPVAAAEPGVSAAADEPAAESGAGVEAEAAAAGKAAEPAGKKPDVPKPERARRISLGSVDAVLASLRTKREPVAPRPAVKADVAVQPAAAESPAAAVPGASVRTGSGGAGAEAESAAAPVSGGESPATAEVSSGAGAFEVAAAAAVAAEPAAAQPAAVAARPGAAAPDEGLPSLDDLEAALATVSRPPPAREASGEILITEGAPAFVHQEAAPVTASPAASGDEGAGLDLPSWDDEAPAPLLSARPGPRPTIDLDLPDVPSEALGGASEMEDDLDVDSLPLGTAPRPAPAGADEATRELFSGMAGQREAAPAVSSESGPELPVVGGVVPAGVGEALRKGLASRAAEDDEAPTSVMTEAEAVAMAASFPPPQPRPSLADLPPPPDMPAPIPSLPPEEKKKAGLLGRIFGRKKK